MVHKNSFAYTIVSVYCLKYLYTLHYEPLLTI